MAFQGWLIKGNMTNTSFPMDLILADTYDVTPDQRSELKADRDNTNYLNRITSPNFKSKITFQTREMNEADMQRIRQWINSNVVNYIQNALSLTIWKPNRGVYENINMSYKTDETYRIKKIDRGENDIAYGKITWTFIQY